MKTQFPALALALLGLTVTAAPPADTIARATLGDETGSGEHLLIVVLLSLLAGLAVTSGETMSTFSARNPH